MASNVYGLIQTDPKKKFSLQTANVETDDPTSGGLQLPTANFSTVPTLQAPPVQSNVRVNPAAIPTNFQFTGRYDAINRGLSGQETDAALQRRSRIADVDEQFRNASQRSADLAKVARSQLQENLASRGLSISGINAQAAGEQEKTYNQYLADLSGSRARALSGVESDYASFLNDIFRQREGLFFDQQKEEEERRLQEERLKAEAEAKRVQAEQQAAMLAQIQAAQEAARQAAAAAAAAASRPTYSAPAIGGGGYAPAPAPAAPAQQQYKPGEQRVSMPNLAQGSTMNSFGNWVRNNLDQYASPAAVEAVYHQLMKDTPNGGTPLSDIAWLIQQYPNAPTAVSKSDVGGKVYGGRFF